MKHRLFAAVLLAISLSYLVRVPTPLPLAQSQAESTQKLTVYFPNWNVYQSDSGQVKQLPWDRLDAIHHAFWKIVPSGDGFAIASTDPWADTDPNNPKAHFPQYAAYAAQYPQVDVLLSIGGWTCSGYFSQMASTKAGRQSFIDSCIGALENYPFFSGLDIDWEYPGVARSGSGSDEGCPVVDDDFTNYTLLLKELRQALDQRFGKGEKLLSVCAGGSEYILSRQDYASLHPYVDAIHLMTYDLTTGSAPETGHHSPLYGSVSADNAVAYLRQKGVPAPKISIGVPLYSHGWKNVSLKGDVLFASASGRSAGGTLLWRKLKVLEAQCVPLSQPGWHQGYDEKAQAAYLWNDDPSSSYYRNFLTYESTRSLKAKLDYAQEKGLYGVIVWQSGGDDIKGGWPMITSIHQHFHP